MRFPQASFAGLQVLYGDVEEAICSHALYYAVWKKWGAIPERFNWQRKEPDVSFYPLRPEFAESTYLLYQVCINFCVACLKVLQSPTIRQPKIRFI